VATAIIERKQRELSGAQRVAADRQNVNRHNTSREEQLQTSKNGKNINFFCLFFLHIYV